MPPSYPGQLLEGTKKKLVGLCPFSGIVSETGSVQWLGLPL
jgi:hypothetical protein